MYLTIVCGDITQTGILRHRQQLGIMSKSPFRLIKICRFSTLCLFVMIAASVTLDQVTKYAAEKHLMVWQDKEDLKIYQGHRVPIWSIAESNLAPDQASTYSLSFGLNYVRNQGAAWGMLSDWHDRYRIPFFFVMTLMAIGLIGFYFYSTPPHHRLARFAFALVMSGALGNFIDRLIRGYVVDFLDVRWTIPLPWQADFTIPLVNLPIGGGSWSYDFPKFNWADSTITIGVVLLLIDVIFLEAKRARRLSSIP